MQYRHHHAWLSGTLSWHHPYPLTTVTGGSWEGHVMQAEAIRILPWEYFSLEVEKNSPLFSSAGLLSRNFFPTISMRLQREQSYYDMTVSDHSWWTWMEKWTQEGPISSVVVYIYIHKSFDILSRVEEFPFSWTWAGLSGLISSMMVCDFGDWS